MIEEPSLTAGDQENLAVMRAAIFKLPEECRESLVQVLLGYSTTEIARELARELDLLGPAVLTRLFRARHPLRALCGADISQGPQE